MSDHQERQLIILAGPSGAGKTTFAGKFSDQNSIVYDPHKESQKIIEKHPNFPFERIIYLIDKNLLSQIYYAIKSQKDFILETDFGSPQVFGAAQIMDKVAIFRDNNYSVNLMYLLLSSEKEAMHRVTSRVAKGGPCADMESITKTYHEGLTNLQSFANRFNRLLILNATKRIGEQEPLLNIEQRDIKYIHQDIPKWAIPIMRSLCSVAFLDDSINEDAMLQLSIPAYRRI